MDVHHPTHADPRPAGSGIAIDRSAVAANRAALPDHAYAADPGGTGPFDRSAADRDLDAADEDRWSDETGARDRPDTLPGC